MKCRTPRLGLFGSQGRVYLGQRIVLTVDLLPLKLARRYCTPTRSHRFWRLPDINRQRLRAATLKARPTPATQGHYCRL